jgi:hypothetical protein
MSVVAPTPPPPAPPTAQQPPQPPTPPSRSGGRIALQVGAVITGLLIILGALNLFQLMSGRSTTTMHRTFTSSVSTMTISTDAADVRLVAGAADVITVDRRVSTPHGRTVDQPSLDGQSLHLPSHCNGSHVGWLLLCSVSYVVHVPEGLDLTVHAGSGDVTVGSTNSSRLAVDVGSGDVRLTRVSSPDVTAETGSGDVDITGLVSSTVVVKTGSGDVHLGFGRAPQDSVEANTGSGDLTISVPRDQTQYLVQGKTGSGDYDNQISTLGQSTAGAAAPSITAETGSGDLTIRYAG